MKYDIISKNRCRVESFAMSLQYCLPNTVLILWLLVLYSFIHYHDQHLPLCPAARIPSPAYDLSTIEYDVVMITKEWYEMIP